MSQKAEFCEFCDLLQKKEGRYSQVIAENEQFFAFHDLDNASAVAHVLVCTKEHIESALHVKEAAQLMRMKLFGKSVLMNLNNQFLYKKAGGDSFLFGFHVPPLVSVYHIHLHCFILPFKSLYQQKYKYAFGPLFKSVQQMMQKVAQRGKL